MIAGPAAILGRESVMTVRDLRKIVRESRSIGPNLAKIASE
jgi:hypothetical protein